MVGAEFSLEKDVVSEAREEFAVYVVGAVFVLFQKLDLRGYCAAVGLVDDALDKWERQSMKIVEGSLDRGIGEGRCYECIEFGDGGEVSLLVIFVTRAFETALETGKLIA